MGSISEAKDINIPRGILIYPINEGYIGQQEIIPFVFNPRPIEQTMSVNLEVIQIPGSSQALYHYVSGGTKELRFTLHIQKDRVNTIVPKNVARTTKEYIDKLIQLQYPYEELSTFTPTQPIVRILLSDIQNLKWEGIVNSVKIVFEDIGEGMKLEYATVDINFMLIVEEPRYFRDLLSPEIVKSTDYLKNRGNTAPLSAIRF